MTWITNMQSKAKLMLLVFFLLIPGSGWSSEPSKVLMIDEMTVQEKSESITAPVPSSTILNSDEIEGEYFDKALYMLQKVPGVVIQDYGQGAVASCFAMRGLRLGHNTGVAIFVDGVPMNESTSHGDGYGDFNTIIPEPISPWFRTGSSASASSGNRRRVCSPGATTGMSEKAIWKTTLRITPARDAIQSAIG